jgi:hypothetical protein
MIDPGAPGAHLAIEPDPHRGAVLHRVLDTKIRAELVVVRTAEALIQSPGTSRI